MKLKEILSGVLFTNGNYGSIYQIIKRKVDNEDRGYLIMIVRSNGISHFANVIKIEKGVIYGYTTIFDSSVNFELIVKNYKKA